MEHKKLVVPVGCKFQPSDEELVIHYLVKRVLGKDTSYFAGAIHECDLFGSKEPWEIWDSYGGNDLERGYYPLTREDREKRAEDGLYFFTHLKKTQDGSKIERAVGVGGRWEAENDGQYIHYRKGNVNVKIAYKKRFYYQNPNPNCSQNNGLWFMDEVSLVKPLTDLVCCKLMKKGLLEDAVVETIPIFDASVSTNADSDGDGCDDDVEYSKNMMADTDTTAS